MRDKCWKAGDSKQGTQRNSTTTLHQVLYFCFLAQIYKCFHIKMDMVVSFSFLFLLCFVLFCFPKRKFLCKRDVSLTGRKQWKMRTEVYMSLSSLWFHGWISVIHSAQTLVYILVDSFIDRKFFVRNSNLPFYLLLSILSHFLSL